MIRGNGTSVNNTVPSSTTEATLFVAGMDPNRLYSIQVAAINTEGRGPFSQPIEIALEKTSGPHYNNLPYYTQAEVARLTWIIVLVAAATCLLLLLSGAFVYKRRMGQRSNKAPLGYLEAAGSGEDFPSRTAYYEGGGKGLWIDNDKPIVRQWRHGNVVRRTFFLPQCAAYEQTPDA